MFNNFFTKCPECSYSIKKDSKNCENCDIKINSSFGSSENFYVNLLGELACKNKMLSHDDFKKIYNEYLSLKQVQHSETIEDMLISSGKISLENMARLIAATLRTMDRKFCEEAVKMNFITEEQAKNALMEQSCLYREKILKSAADLLKEKNLLTDIQIENLLRKQDIQEMTADKNNEKRKSAPARNLKIARLAVQYNYLTDKEMEKEIQKWSGLSVSKNFKKDFLQYLLENKILTKKEITILSLHYEYNNLKKLDVMFGKLAVFYKFISQENIEHALNIQKEIFKKKLRLISLPEILSKKKLLADNQIYKILKEQKRENLAGIFYKKLDINKEKLQENPEQKTRPDKDESKEKSQIKIEISEDLMEALLYPPLEETDIFEIKDVLKKKGIVYGVIDDNIILSYLKKKSEQPVAIAKGTPAVEPVNAQIKCHFAENYLNVGTINEDGDIDFMDRGEVPSVERDELIAEKIPLKYGKPGMDILGNEIPVEIPLDINIGAGKGARLDESCSKVYSEEPGQPHISINGDISVLNVHEVKGDVDFHTGHINFNGNIIILGTIKSGFKVTGNDIIVDEVIEGIIEAKGHVEVKKGIFGGKISSEQGIKAKFINNSHINSFGDISVEKEIIDSVVKTSGVASVSSGKIISSMISAKSGVEVKQIDTEVSEPSTIEIGSSAYLDAFLEPYETEIEKTKKNLEDFKKNMTNLQERDRVLHLEIAEKAQIHDKSEQALKKLIEHKSLIQGTRSLQPMDQINEKIESLEIKIKDFGISMEKLFDEQDKIQGEISTTKLYIKKSIEKKEELKSQIETIKNYDQAIKPSPVLIVKGTIEKGAKINGPDSKLEVSEKTKNIKFHEIHSQDADGNPIHIIKADKNK
ncbi:MAG: hypothetical protein CSB21_02730 [Deltaproteobacteria bacterium]|nr:MAG: hypothetical protein CSB21_02730 [Deltaproteobacteria bacterium]